MWSDKVGDYECPYCNRKFPGQYEVKNLRGSYPRAVVLMKHFAELNFNKHTRVCGKKYRENLYKKHNRIVDDYAPCEIWRCDGLTNIIFTDGNGVSFRACDRHPHNQKMTHIASAKEREERYKKYNYETEDSGPCDICGTMTNNMFTNGKGVEFRACPDHPHGNKMFYCKALKEEKE